MWFNSFVNVICDGNEVYDELYSNNTVYFDVNWKGFSEEPPSLFKKLLRTDTHKENLNLLSLGDRRFLFDVLFFIESSMGILI